jgi:hypothetical protein
VPSVALRQLGFVLHMQPFPQSHHLSQQCWCELAWSRAESSPVRWRLRASNEPGSMALPPLHAIVHTQWLRNCGMYGPCVMSIASDLYSLPARGERRQCRPRVSSALTLPFRGTA